MASLSSSICLSKPPISVYSSEGFSSSSIDLTLESYSAGNFQRRMQESLFTPTSYPGLSSAASTRPGTGRKMVFLVLVLTTTHLSYGFSSGSTSQSPSFSGQISSISTILETSQGSCLFCLILVLLSLSDSSTFLVSWLILLSSSLYCLILFSNILILPLISSFVRCFTCQGIEPVSVILKNIQITKQNQLSKSIRLSKFQWQITQVRMLQCLLQLKSFGQAKSGALVYKGLALFIKDLASLKVFGLEFGKICLKIRQFSNIRLFSLC